MYIGPEIAPRPPYIAIKNIFILFYHNLTHLTKISIFRILPQNTTCFPETKA